MGYWRRHPKKDGQALLEWFDDHGWKIGNPPTYYTVRCPCGDHQRQIKLTPSDPNFWKNAQKWAQRQSCMMDREDKDER